MKILIIEDELEIRETLRDLLELNGHTVLVAIDGPMGVNLAAEQPDLILCDIGMPGMNGYQVITAIKALPAGQDIPFVFLTAWADREHQRQGMTLGADDYITKPFTQSDILDAIAARMQRLRPLRERILALLADRRVVPRPIGRMNFCRLSMASWAVWK
jgi:CheY-like chemotaxis protein